MLPFAYLSGDPEQEYFTDGMVEEIIRALSRIIVRPLLDREPMEPRRDTVNRPAASRYRHYASSTPPSPAH